jgi:hypothetical protein
VQWDNFEDVFFLNSIYAETGIGEIIGVRGVYGTISDANRGINASGLQYMAPENVYWEYSAELETSSKCLYRFCWRGNYLNTPDTQRFSVKGSLILFRAISVVHYIFYAKPWHKRMSFPSGLKSA